MDLSEQELRQKSAELPERMQALIVQSSEFSSHNAGKGGVHPDACIEFTKRLRQLKWILEQVLDRISQNRNKEKLDLIEADQHFSEEMKEIDALHSKLSFEVELLTESFYFFAHRIKTMIAPSSKKKSLIPPLNNFKSSATNAVRNNLIEHAGVHHPLCINSFSWLYPQGPILKPFRWKSQPGHIHDAGLFINAIEFVDNLSACLDEATKNIPSDSKSQTPKV